MAGFNEEIHEEISAIHATLFALKAALNHKLDNLARELHQSFTVRVDPDSKLCGAITKQTPTSQAFCLNRRPCPFHDNSDLLSGASPSGAGGASLSGASPVHDNSDPISRERLYKAEPPPPATEWDPDKSDVASAIAQSSVWGASCCCKLPGPCECGAWIE